MTPTDSDREVGRFSCWDVEPHRSPLMAAWVPVERVAISKGSPRGVVSRKGRGSRRRPAVHVEAPCVKIGVLVVSAALDRPLLDASRKLGICEFAHLHYNA